MYKNFIKIFMAAFMLLVTAENAQSQCAPCKATYDQCMAAAKGVAAEVDKCTIAMGDCTEQNNINGCPSETQGNPCEQCTSLFESCKKQGTNEDECIKAQADCIQNNADKGCVAPGAPAAAAPVAAPAPAPAAGQNPCEQCTDVFNKCDKAAKNRAEKDNCVKARSDCIQRNEDKGCGSTMGGNVCQQCSLDYDNCIKQGTSAQECNMTRADCIDNNKAKGCQ